MLVQNISVKQSQDISFKYWSRTSRNTSCYRASHSNNGIGHLSTQGLIWYLIHILVRDISLHKLLCIWYRITHVGIGHLCTQTLIWYLMTHAGTGHLSTQANIRYLISHNGTGHLLHKLSQNTIW
jgi:hypothetical protein